VVFSRTVFVINNGDEGGLDFTKGFMGEQRLDTTASIHEFV
jgi:hypothetical protein